MNKNIVNILQYTILPKDIINYIDKYIDYRIVCSLCNIKKDENKFKNCTNCKQYCCNNCRKSQTVWCFKFLDCHYCQRGVCKNTYLLHYCVDCYYSLNYDSSDSDEMF